MACRWKDHDACVRSRHVRLSYCLQHLAPCKLTSFSAISPISLVDSPPCPSAMVLWAEVDILRTKLPCPPCYLGRTERTCRSDLDVRNCFQGALPFRLPLCRLVFLLTGILLLTRFAVTRDSQTPPKSSREPIITPWGGKHMYVISREYYSLPAGLH